MERLRESSAVAAAGPLRLIRDILPALLLRRWPVAWGLLHLSGSALGGWAADSASLPPGVERVGYVLLVRAATLVPLLTRFRSRGLQLAAWGLVFLLSVLAGQVETRERRERRAATAPAPWIAASEREYAGASVLRTTGWGRAGRYGSWSAPARLLAWRPAVPLAGGPRIGEGILLRGEGDVPAPGARLAGPLRLRVPSRSSVPGGFDYRAFLAGRSLRWTGRLEEAVPAGDDPVSQLGRRALAPLRATILRSLAALFPSREAELAAAVLLGRRTPDSRRAAAPFADLGLAHLFSVSGLHVGILLGMILLPGRLISLPPALRLLPLAITLPIYVTLTGLPGSVLRAAGLGWLAVLAATAGRRADALHLVGCLFWLGSIWDPRQNLDTGLRLSYLAAGGILALASVAERNGLLGSGRIRWIAGGVLVSLAAQWFTLPVVAASFGRISLLSPLANLFAVPLFGMALWLVVVALICAAGWPWLGQALAAWAWLILRALAGAVQAGSEATGGALLSLPVPGPGRIVLLGALTIVVLGWVHGRWGNRWSRPRRLAAVLVVLALGFGGVAPWTGTSRPSARCWIFDVGQGDCALLQLGDGWTAMIDTGGRFGRGASVDGPLARNILPFLQRRRIDRIDAVVLTHDHLDHTGGLAALLPSVAVGEVWCGGRSERSLARADSTRKARRPRKGEVLHRWRDWELVVLYGAGPVPADLDENDRSTVLGLRRAGATLALFSGDLEHGGEALWADRDGFPAGVQVWKAGHHGSDTSGSPALLEATRPELVVVSCGVGNRYGHPNHGPYLAGADTLAVRRTDLDGTMRITWDGEGNRLVRLFGNASSRGRLDTAASRF